MDETLAGSLALQEEKWLKELDKTLGEEGDPAQIASRAIRSALELKADSQQSFSEILGLDQSMDREQALAYLMAVQMRADSVYRWTREEMLDHLNQVMDHLGAFRVSRHTLDKWMKMNFNPPWEPRTKGQAPGRIIGTPYGAEDFLTKNKQALLEELHDLDMSLDHSRTLSGSLKAKRQKLAAGFAERIAADINTLQVDGDKTSLRKRAYVRAIQRIIENYSRVTPHRPPEGVKLPQSTQTLFALINDNFNYALRKEGSYLYASGKLVTGKEAEEWWRNTMIKSLNLVREGDTMTSPGGVKYTVQAEHSSTDVFDMIVTIKEPGSDPLHLTMQFKSYQNGGKETTKFKLCTLGKPEEKNPEQRLAREIRARLHNTGAFANITIKPTREGEGCALRRADKVTHRAECLHPEVQAAITEKRLVGGLHQVGQDGARAAVITDTLSSGEEFTVKVKVSKSGEVTISGLDNNCWIPVNTSTFITATAARSDRELLGRLSRREERRLRKQESDDDLFA